MDIFYHRRNWYWVDALYRFIYASGEIRDGAIREATGGYEKSPRFKDGKFENIYHAPELTEGYSVWDVTWEFIFSERPRRIPLDSIPSMKSDLFSLPLDWDVLVWFGHSSFYIQLDGKRILSDPVFSGNASPIPGTNISFKGTDRYTVNDLPEIDYLFLSHDHYDHVDYETLVRLKAKVKKVICGLGIGQHFERWGYAPEVVFERDWGQSVDLDSGFIAHVTPARHFSSEGSRVTTPFGLHSCCKHQP